MFDLDKLDNIKTIVDLDGIYNDLFVNGINSVLVPAPQYKPKAFTRACHCVIEKYLKWNDYIHSNDIMQLYKSVMHFEKVTDKPSWLLRYEIIVYGKRTPLYFIKRPDKLFEKIIIVFERNKQGENENLISAIKTLFTYYYNNFLTYNSESKDRKIFWGAFVSYFIPGYKASYKKLPEEIDRFIKQYIDYAEAPDKYYEPGCPKNCSSDIDEDELSDEEEINDDDDSVLEYLHRKTIKLIGDFNKQSIKGRLRYYSSEYDFEVDDSWTDYAKITNKDFKTLRYSNRVSGLLIGPMPHSVKNKGEYSSALEMMKTEQGYPPVVICTIRKDKLEKVSLTSLKKGLIELVNILRAEGK